MTSIRHYPWAPALGERCFWAAALVAGLLPLAAWPAPQSKCLDWATAGSQESIQMVRQDAVYTFCLESAAARQIRLEDVEGQVECRKGKPQKVVQGQQLEIQGECTVGISAVRAAPHLVLLQEKGEEKRVALAKQGESTIELLGVPVEIVLLGVAVFALILGALVWLFMWKGTGDSRGRPDGEQFAAPDLYGAPTRAAGPWAGPTAAPSRAPAAPPAPQPSPVEREVAELRDLYGRVDLAVRTIDATQRSLLPDLDGKLQRFLESVQGEVAEQVGDVERSARELHRQNVDEVLDLRGRVENMELQLSRLHGDARAGLQRLLENLPVSLLDRPLATQTQNGKTLAARVEEAVANYFSSAGVNLAVVARFRDQGERLGNVLEAFRRLASVRDQVETDSKLRPLLEDLCQMRDELAGLSQSGNQQRLRLNFVVEIATHEAARQKVGEAIAAGLQREIVRLENLEEYYEKRFLLLATRAAVECVDFADTRVDPERQRREVQQALGEVMAAGGLTEIAPSRNDQFQGLEHTVLQMMRCASPQDRRGAVARLVARGFRHGGRVLRKATVMVFD